MNERDEMLEARRRMMAGWLLFESQASEEGIGAGVLRGTVTGMFGDAFKLVSAVAKNFASANWAAFRSVTALTNDGANKAISAHRQRSSQYASESKSALDNATKALDNPVINAIGFNNVADIGTKIGTFQGIDTSNAQSTATGILKYFLQKKERELRTQNFYGDIDIDPRFVQEIKKFAQENSNFKEFLRSKKVVVENTQINVDRMNKAEMLVFLLGETMSKNDQHQLFLEQDQKNNNQTELVKSFFLFLMKEMQKPAIQYQQASKKMMDLDFETIQEILRSVEINARFLDFFDENDEKKMEELKSSLKNEAKKKEFELVLNNIKEGLSKENEIVDLVNSIGERYKFDKKLTEKVQQNIIPEKLEDLINLEPNALKAKLQEFQNASKILLRRAEMIRGLLIRIKDWAKELKKIIT